MLAIAVVAGLVVAVHGHGAVVNPPPRNAVDRDLKPWSGAVPVQPPNVESDTGWCQVPGEDGKPSGRNGQACFWFSNGCAVGCDTCDGNSRGPIPSSYKTNTVPPTGVGRNKVGPNGVVCKSSNGVKPTICDPELRTVNQNATCGGEDDWYYFSPWRAPGAAPVIDACGVAGGHRPPDGPFGGIYVNTTHAKLGDLGSEVLPAMASGTVWKAGSAVEVTWSIEANHAGGYQYRLAPAHSKLTESEFQKMPLPFVGKQGLRWNGGKKHGGKEVWFNGTYATSGTMPKGSAWARNPIPLVTGKYGLFGSPKHLPVFPAPCDDPADCSDFGDGNVGNPSARNMEIVDYVQIPASLPPGGYVLGWRWDCEQSNQVWSSCSDVTITA